MATHALTFPERGARQVVLEFVLLAATKKTLMLDRLIESVRRGPSIQDSFEIESPDSFIHLL